MPPNRFLFILPVFLVMACQSTSSSDSLILKILENRGKVVDQILSDPEAYEVQILYTQIDRDSLNHPHFTSYAYRVKDDTYFYPASTVKFPAAVLALEKIRSLNIAQLRPDTPMLTDSAFTGQTVVREDTSAENGLPSIAHYIKKILLVSDNDAFNRLYEFLGQKEMNHALWQKGHDKLRIIHRLSVFQSQEQNRHTNPIRFVKEGDLIYQQGLVVNDMPIPLPSSIPRGVGYMRGGELQQEPMDFASKNFFPLREQQAILRSVLFPESVEPHQRFELSDRDYTFLYQYLSQLPSETNWPQYDPEHYYDGYVKFFLFGDSTAPIPPNIRIFNKVGDAYGTLTDNAYIVDFGTGIEFLLSATVFVNQNQIFNDDTYEYDSLGFPFMAEVGRAFYEYELQRTRQRTPDLSCFQLTYDK
ncbi:MAG: serine hydrolase [Bacteroidota bacterium]